MIRGIFRSRCPRPARVPFVEIDRLSQRQPAAALAASAVFLASGYPEGFGLPPLEALACGCLVVGFAGRGGREYLRHGENCLLAAEGEVLGAAEQLARALGLLAGGAAPPLPAPSAHDARARPPHHIGHAPAHPAPCA